MRDGIILINKPKGPSSNQTLQKVKQRLAIKKAGHFGTLDPLASGLLIIGLNKGTKLSKLFLRKMMNLVIQSPINKLKTNIPSKGP